ncbi:MAG: hypothetical protein QOJ81_2028 [Chloroflexota bacterium]|nr:hypothetical protein [Chloroflexota bacterium]
MHQAGVYSQGMGTWLWMIVFIVTLPVIALLVLIGLIYELVIQLDGHRLGTAVEWAISSASAVALLVGAYWVFLRH